MVPLYSSPWAKACQPAIIYILLVSQHGFTGNKKNKNIWEFEFYHALEDTCPRTYGLKCVSILHHSYFKDVINFCGWSPKS